MLCLHLTPLHSTSLHSIYVCCPLLALRPPLNRYKPCDTPPVLLALICQHLQAADILRLLRCCSTLHRTSDSDAAFSSDAWRHASLTISIDKRAHQWVIPHSSVHCSDVSGKRKWLVALPAWLASTAVIRYSFDEWRQANEPTAPVAALVQAATAAEQPPTVVLSCQEYVLLSEQQWSAMDEMYVLHEPAYRSRFVLSATPHLQHLSLSIDAYLVNDTTPAADSLRLVPHLRSLHVRYFRSHELNDDPPAFPVRCALSALPCLTSLACVQLHRMQDMIDIAAHATLECVRLHSRSLACIECLNAQHCTECSTCSVDFDTNDDVEWVGDEYSESGSGSVSASETEAEAEAEVADSKQRLQAALTRVSPTLRSITSRLSLTAYLRYGLAEECL